jgi:hypothetical protein
MYLQTVRKVAESLPIRMSSYFEAYLLHHFGGYLWVGTKEVESCRAFPDEFPSSSGGRSGRVDTPYMDLTSFHNQHPAPQADW